MLRGGWSNVACRCSNLIFHQNKLYSERNHIIMQLSRHTKCACNSAILSLHPSLQCNEALLLKDFHSPTSPSRELSILGMHKGNFYKLENGPICNKKQLLPKRFLFYLQNYCYTLKEIYIYLSCRRKRDQFCFVINIPKPTLKL